jgi:LDH2 family malate/lactate/ureidoglycolate dehydrogenase
MPAQQPGKGIGHFFGAMRIDAFRSAEEYKKSMDHWIRGFRQAKPVAGQERVLIPGDPERQSEEERRKNGIPLVEAVIHDLHSLGERFALPFPGQ